MRIIKVDFEKLIKSALITKKKYPKSEYINGYIDALNDLEELTRKTK